MKNLIRTLLILVFPLFVLACTPSSGIQLKDTQAGLQEEVDRFIKVGMPVQKAKQIIENSNFICEDTKDSKFAIENRDSNGRLISQTLIRGDYLSCTVTHSYFIASKAWNVILLYKNNRVVMIHTVIHHQNL